MPAAIERSVRRQNIKFMHNRNQFSVEYFQFIRKLASCNIPPPARQHNADKFVSKSSICSCNLTLVTQAQFRTVWNLLYYYNTLTSNQKNYSKIEVAYFKPEKYAKAFL